MQSDPIQDGIYNYFPIILALICLCTLFNVFHYIKDCVSFQKRFQFTEDFMDPQIEEGERIVTKEKDARRNNSSTVRGIPKTSSFATAVPTPGTTDISDRQTNTKNINQNPDITQVILEDNPDPEPEILEKPVFQKQNPKKDKEYPWERPVPSEKPKGQYTHAFV